METSNDLLSSTGLGSAEQQKRNSNVVGPDDDDALMMMNELTVCCCVERNGCWHFHRQIFGLNTPPRLGALVCKHNTNGQKWPELWRGIYAPAYKHRINETFRRHKMQSRASHALSMCSLHLITFRVLGGSVVNVIEGEMLRIWRWVHPHFISIPLKWWGSLGASW